MCHTKKHKGILVALTVLLSIGSVWSAPANDSQSKQIEYQIEQVARLARKASVRIQPLLRKKEKVLSDIVELYKEKSESPQEKDEKQNLLKKKNFCLEILDVNYRVLLIIEKLESIMTDEMDETVAIYSEPLRNFESISSQLASLYDEFERKDEESVKKELSRIKNDFKLGVLQKEKVDTERKLIMARGVVKNGQEERREASLVLASKLEKQLNDIEGAIARSKK